MFISSLTCCSFPLIPVQHFTKSGQSWKLQTSASHPDWGWKAAHWDYTGQVLLLMSSVETWNIYTTHLPKFLSCTALLHRKIIWFTGLSSLAGRPLLAIHLLSIGVVCKLSSRWKHVMLLGLSAHFSSRRSDITRSDHRVNADRTEKTRIALSILKGSMKWKLWTFIPCFSWTFVIWNICSFLDPQNPNINLNLNCSWWAALRPILRILR